MKNQSKIDMVFVQRVKQWNKFEYFRSCSFPRCTERAKRTDVGLYCFFHYLNLQSCEVEGCCNPVAFRSPPERLCRHHFVVGDGKAEAEYLELSRQRAVSSGQSLMSRGEIDAPGRDLTIPRKRPKKKAIREISK